MMTELSLHVLDIAQNSTRAGARLITIEIKADTDNDYLMITISDDGCGMSKEQLASVTDPFYTSRTTRKVGLGIPFFKQAAELSGGTFSIQSETGRGTVVCAVFVLSGIDRMPLGDISSTIYTLVVYHPETDFVYHYCYNHKTFTLDTREFRKVLGNIPFDTPEVSQYIMEYLTTNKTETDRDVFY